MEITRSKAAACNFAEWVDIAYWLSFIGKQACFSTLPSLLKCCSEVE